MIQRNFRVSRPPAALELAVGIIVWLAVLFLLKARFGASEAVDLRPIYESGVAARSGTPIYSVPNFVYPPFAAFVAIPLSLLSYSSATSVYSVIQVIIPVSAAAWLGLVYFRKYKVLAAGVSALFLLKSDVFVDSLPTYNPSLLFILPLVAIIICWSTGHWKVGVVVLSVSVAIKPLLILLFLLLVVRRRWRDASLGIFVTLVLTSVGIAFSHDFHGLLRLPLRILKGTNLHGSLQKYNVSLSSIGIVHSELHWPLYVLRLLFVFAAVVVIWRSRCWAPALDLTAIATGVLALLLPVCGGLSEVHYGLLALPAAAVLLSGSQGRLPQTLAGCGILVLCAPLYNLHIPDLSDRAAQLRWGVGQATVLVACIAAGLRVPRGRDVSANDSPVRRKRLRRARRPNLN